MNLKIYDYNLNEIQSVEYEMSYYDNDRIRYMSDMGYSFQLDGRWIAIGKYIRDIINGRSTKNERDIRYLSLSELRKIAKDASCKVLEEYHNESECLETSTEDHDSDQVNNIDIMQDPNLKTMIKCLETGKLYAKQSHAARDLGIDPSCVSDSIKTGRPRKGYTFKKVIV